MTLILLFLLLAYGGPFVLGCLFFRLRRKRCGVLPTATRSRARSATLPLLCAASLLLAYGLGHFKVLSYPGAIMLSMVLGAPAFFLAAAQVVKPVTPGSEEQH
ncbi:hypothetical protein HBDW_30320 [Herbaspirillum sp. DW155]|uniref:hypothetical protein n=1 Tax=Herbaspirillum sp. DW155 TaxID=3095609 RepID=UPI0030869A24|nr:hypothetical protein HBDW_30320 [Herbaspirillum sp. DW155]